MSVKLYSIAQFEFDELLGDPDLATQRPSLFQREGVSGSGGFWGGIRGRPFQLKSGIALYSRADANWVYEAYGRIKGLFGPVFQANVPLASRGEFFIQDVRRVEARELLTTVGTLNPDAKFWLGAVWTLVHVDN